MSQFPNGPDPNELIRRLEGLPLEERGYQPDVDAGYQPAQDSLPLDDFELPTINDTLDGDTGDEATD